MKHYKNYFSMQIIIIVLLQLSIFSCSHQNNQIIISADVENSKVQFAVDEIKASFAVRGIAALVGENENADIVISVQPGAKIKSEGFILKKTSENKISLLSSDAAGAMYGGLEIAEQIKLFGLDGIQETTQNPYMELRGTKHNIPLDVRTPSYTDPSDAAQKNIGEMWSFDFWKEYIDNMARYRYNFISLWSLHPFPSMVKVPGYEDVALADVQRSTVKWKENYSLNGIGFDAPEILANPEIVKKMSIEEKIEFWKKVMAYGKSRNVDFYVITWNIFVNGTDGKYGITDDIDNEITRDYFRKSVKQMFISYPDLQGIGLTTGENMHGSSSAEKEDWAFETYALGVLDASEEMPDRKITFVHRQHQTGAKEIADQFKPLLANKNIDFIFSFKYAKAHVMSATEQPFHQDFVKDISKEGLKTIWTLRNDDDFYFRWGSPDFVREFMQNIPHEVSRGFYYGSDQWIWGREFTMKDEYAESPRQIEIVKHWYHFMLWGRLGYNPDLSDERFTQILQNRFPEVDAKLLFTAWEDASMIYPTTTGFHWGSLDFQWYIEACKSTPGYAQNNTGFHDVNRFINLPSHAKSGFQSIPDYVNLTIDEGNSDLKSPFEVAEKLHSYSDNALEIVEAMNAGEDKELKVTLHDIKTIALLGKYYAFKISGSTQLALYRETKEKKYQEEAIADLEKALQAWKDYVDAALQQNINPLWTNRVGYVDWVKITDWVADDIKIAKEN